MPALRGFALLLVLQSLGEVLTHALGWLVPGPVLGLLLLFGALFWAPLRAPIEAAAQVLLAHLSLLFVPVGAGIVLHTGLLAEHGAVLLLTLAVSTAIGIGVTGLVLQALLRRGGHGGALEAPAPHDDPVASTPLTPTPDPHHA